MVTLKQLTTLLSRTKQGFASMTKEELQVISREGGEARRKQLGRESYAEMVRGVVHHERNR